jgi:hypothetical protein
MTVLATQGNLVDRRVKESGLLDMTIRTDRRPRLRETGRRRGAKDENYHRARRDGMASASAKDIPLTPGAHALLMHGRVPKTRVGTSRAVPAIDSQIAD